MLGQPPPSQQDSIFWRQSWHHHAERIQNRRCGRPVNGHSMSVSVPPPPDGKGRRDGQDVAVELRLKPVPVPPEVQGPELLARLAHHVPLADQHLIAPPTKRLALSPVAPAHHGAPAGERPQREVLEPQNLLDNWTAQ